jgi:hypothetical protein
MGYNQNAWGEYVWIAEHVITANYPFDPTNEHKKAAIAHFRSLILLLPCEVCQKNFKRKLIIKPVEDHVQSREVLFKWLVDLHNEVNVSLGKKEWEYLRAQQYYSKLLKKTIYLTKEEENGVIVPTQKNNTNNHNIYIAIIGASVFGGLLYTYMSKTKSR